MTATLPPSWMGNLMRRMANIKKWCAARLSLLNIEFKQIRTTDKAVDLRQCIVGTELRGTALGLYPTGTRCISLVTPSRFYPVTDLTSQIKSAFYIRYVPW